MLIDEVIEITSRKIFVDEDVYIVDANMVEECDKLKKRINRSDSMIYTRLEKDLEFITKHKDFSIIFRPIIRNQITRWLPCMVYSNINRLERVSIQNVYCLNCNWTGIIANPLEPDLYITMKNRFEILDRLSNILFCKCPKCKGELSNKGIWVE